ncbi:deleted in malignant brain tumors 1 protein-like isoform X2 [Poeciliopsis prolifica]|uniref:deleted in malignant brain tumors 1 protein-like isoform X2 n=1 Tax=Poeciliopsis prolifica TaxID=188132 RepID=UPI0024138936|nr:deleted in malignant brain tumors 1 protein-like isoform X2 [Poeciliopsis prolifica]
MRALVFLCSVLITQGVQGWWTTEDFLQTTTPMDYTGINCDGYLYNNNGTFQSPNYPSNYPNNAKCTWYIRPSLSGHSIRLELVNLRAECSFDWFDIYDGYDTNSRRVRQLCSANSFVYHSTGRYLTIHFSSDSSVTGQGFLASYKVVAEGSCKYNCGYQVGNCSCQYDCEYRGTCCADYATRCGSSNTSPYPYPTTSQPSCRYNCGYNMGSCSCSSSCQWNGNCCHDYYSYCGSSPTTSYPEPTSPQPSCRYNCGYNMGSCSCSSSCQWNGNCCHDYYSYCGSSPTTIYPEPTSSQPSCRYNCGYNIGSCSCSSSCQWNGNCCHDYYSYCGTSPEVPTTGPCGGSLFGSGTISSPNHPDYYNDNSYCVWQLRAAYDQRIFLAFSYLQLENCCNCDYISIYDGPYTYSPYLGKVCNNTLSTFYSSSNYMTVIFRTDGSVVGRGFRAEFMSSLKPSSGRVDCSSDNMNIVINRAYLNSLGYDGHSLYLDDENCKPQISSYEVTFSFPLYACGTVKHFNSGRVVYTNNIRGFPSSQGEIVRQSYLKMNVNCTMEEDSMSQIMFVVGNGGNSSIAGSGHYNTSMAFYTSSSFSYKVTNVPYQVALNQDLYVQVDLSRHDSNLVLFLDTCVAAPSPFDFETRPYYLVRNGCTVDSTYRPISSGSWYRARFTFKAFMFLRGTESVYLQCKVLICPSSESNSRCRRGCSRRRARELEPKHESQTLVMGPIQLKKAEEEKKEPEEQNEA